MLTDDAKAELDALIETLQSDPRNVYLEIEGHTDATGSAEYNHELGAERAEAVKRYLYESHSIPLHKMNVISYGETKPIARNDKRDGRSQNRRLGCASSRSRCDSGRAGLPWTGRSPGQPCVTGEGRSSRQGGPSGWPIASSR